MISGKLNVNAGEFNGMFIKHAKDKVKEKLELLGLGGTFLETSRRTGHSTTVIVEGLNRYSVNPTDSASFSDEIRYKSTW